MSEAFCLWIIAGVDVSIEEIQSTVTAVLEENMVAILEQRYHINGLPFFSLRYCILMIAILWFLFSLWSYPNIIMFVHANVCQPLFSKLTNLIWISWSILGSFWFEKSQFHEIMIKLTRNKLKSTGCHCKIKIRIAID